MNINETYKRKNSQVEQEPTFTILSSDKIGLIKGLNFYSRNHDYADSKKWAIAWLKKNRADLAEKLAGLEDSYFSNRGFICRMMERGYVISPEQEADLIKYFEKLQFVKQEEPAVKPVIKTKSKVIEVNPCLQSLDDVIDATLEGKTPPVLTLNDNKSHVQAVVDYCERTIKEMTEYSEYYNTRTMKILKPVLQQCRDKALVMIKALENKKTITKAPKKVNPIKMTKSVRYQKEDQVLGIKSVPITSVVGARKMYVYDTKHKKLRLYVANNPQGFMFVGTTLKNYDPEKSVYKTVRKPEKFFEQFKKDDGVRSLNKLFKELATTENNIGSKGRFSENFIILGVI
jgi:hypothetical protein